MKREHKYFGANDVRTIRDALSWYRVQKVKLCAKDKDYVSDKLLVEEIDHLTELINVFGEIKDEMGTEIEIII